MKDDIQMRHERYACLVPVLKQLEAALKEKNSQSGLSCEECKAGNYEVREPVVIAIDGPAASGKTTVAGLLAEVLNADVIHMDDFFLPPELRTPERFAMPGGNVHTERFLEEVIPNLRRAEGFVYRRFECSVMDYGAERPVGRSPVRIVEGVYSHHPVLGDYADLKVFLTVGKEEQAQRILKRDGPEKAARYMKEWIPLENRYFKAFKICEHAFVFEIN